MKMRELVSFVPLLTLIPALRAAPYFTDPFSGDSLNLSHWVPSTPFPDSSVLVADESLVLNNRGRVITTGHYPDPFELTMRFQITGTVFESFKIGLRTDGTTTNPPHEFDAGIFASFRIRSDPGDLLNNVTIYSQDHPIGELLAQGTFAMQLNTPYDLKIVDTGSSVSLFLNDFSAPFLTAASSAAYGHQVGFYNREGAGAGSFISAGAQVKVDFFEIMSARGVPDGNSTLGLLALVGVGGLLIQLRHERSRR